MLAALTFIHTALSLVALVAGIPVIMGLLGRAVSPFWTTLFLWTAIATSVTGFFFPFNGVLPSHIVGALALIVLAAVLAAQYAYGYAGPWRWVYAVGMVISVYFLAFVGVVQAFLKIPALNALAPTQTEAPFAIAQLVLLAVCVAVGFLAARSFRAQPA